MLAIALLLPLTSSAAVLHSNPLAPNVLFMDASGGWSATDAQVHDTWALVAAYFARWNIDVTDAYPGSRPDVVHAVIGGFGSGNGIVGEAATGTWHYGTSSFLGNATACYIYADALGDDPDLVAYVIAHESEHNLGQGHEPDGIMEPVVNLAHNYWSPADIAWNDSQLGVSQPEVIVPDLPEPHALLLGTLAFVMSQRAKRQNGPRPVCSGTASTDRITVKSRDAIRAALSASAASTNIVSAKSSSQFGCSLCPSILKRMGEA